jgi:hypothetical protein
MSIDVEAAGAGRVLFANEDAGVAVAIARPLVVLLAYGAFADEVISVKLEPPVVKLEVEFEMPVAKIELDDVVALAMLTVAFVAVALLYQVKGG